ncbi:hypothetical protein IWX92DRAFT_67393 [Phyllosticta citricarpa]
MDGCRSLLHAWPLRRRRDRGRRWLESMSSGARAACTAWSVPLWTRRRFFPAVIVLLLLWSLLLHLGQPNRLPLFRCSSSCSRPAGLILLLLFRVDYWLAGRLCCNSMHASKQRQFALVLLHFAIKLRLEAASELRVFCDHPCPCFELRPAARGSSSAAWLDVESSQLHRRSGMIGAFDASGWSTWRQLCHG